MLLNQTVDLNVVDGNSKNSVSFNLKDEVFATENNNNESNVFLKDNSSTSTFRKRPIVTSSVFRKL